MAPRKKAVSPPRGKPDAAEQIEQARLYLLLAREPAWLDTLLQLLWLSGLPSDEAEYLAREITGQPTLKRQWLPLKPTYRRRTKGPAKARGPNAVQAAADCVDRAWDYLPARMSWLAGRIVRWPSEDDVLRAILEAGLGTPITPPWLDDDDDVLLVFEAARLLLTGKKTPAERQEARRVLGDAAVNAYAGGRSAGNKSGTSDGVRVEMAVAAALRVSDRTVRAVKTKAIAQAQRGQADSKAWPEAPPGHAVEFSASAQAPYVRSRLDPPDWLRGAELSVARRALLGSMHVAQFAKRGDN